MSKPQAQLALMAQTAPITPADRSFFPTQPWAGRAGAERVLAMDPWAQRVLEPACGEHHLAFALEDYFGEVGKSDIEPYLGGHVLHDFLDGPLPCALDGPWDWVITNPPFPQAAEFIRRAWRVAERGVAMLLPLRWLECIERWDLDHEIPPAMCAPFVERVPMFKGRWDPDGDTATAYAWFFWVKRDVLALTDLGQACLAAMDLDACLTLKIPPGQAKRLSLRKDLVRFGKAADAPLLAGLEP